MEAIMNSLVIFLVVICLMTICWLAILAARQWHILSSRIRRQQRGCCPIDNDEPDYSALRFNEDLANRFVSDYKLPVSITNNAQLFFYQLNLYEDRWKAMTKWKTLIELIDRNFDGSAENFLNEYKRIREAIIKETSESKAFKKFNEMDMNVFNVKKPAAKYKTLYNEENVDDYFLSVDLSKANFQALNHVNRDILRRSETYEEFIEHFTDLKYVKESKYTREVVFGQLNPSRHTTIETFLLMKVWKAFKDLKISDRYKSDDILNTLSVDEFVIKIDDQFPVKMIKFLVDDILMETGIDVHMDAFKLIGYDVLNKRNGHQRATFYVKKFMDGRPDELYCVPQQYHTIVWKLFNGMEMERNDKYFNYERNLAFLCDDLEIKQIAKREPKKKKKK